MFRQLLVYILLSFQDVHLQSLQLKVEEQTNSKARIIDYSNNYDDVWDKKPTIMSESISIAPAEQEGFNEKKPTLGFSSVVPSIKTQQQGTVSTLYQNENDHILFDDQVEVHVAYDDIDFEEDDPFESTGLLKMNTTEEDVYLDTSNLTHMSAEPKVMNTSESHQALILTQNVSVPENVTTSPIKRKDNPKGDLTKTAPSVSNFSKIWNFIGGLFGSTEPPVENVEVKATEESQDIINIDNSTITVVKDLSAQSVELYHSFHESLLKHFCHSDRKLVEFQRSHGYKQKMPVGRVISSKRFERKRLQLLKKCPYLIEMKNLMSTKATQYLTIDSREAENIAKHKSWRGYASAGYCVKEKGMCGADQELIVMWKRDHGKNDFDYVVSLEDQKKLTEEGFQKKSSLCFIWPL